MGSLQNVKYDELVHFIPSGNDSVEKMQDKNYQSFAYTDVREENSSSTRLIELYPLKLESETDFTLAHRLFGECINLLSSANEVYESDHIKSADLCLNVIGILYELYCLRKIGEGFSMIINALLNALINLDGKRLNRSQLFTFIDILRSLSSRPNPTTNEAIELAESLENLDLDVMAKGLNELINQFNGD